MLLLQIDMQYHERGFVLEWAIDPNLPLVMMYAQRIECCRQSKQGVSHDDDQASSEQHQI